MGPKAWVTLRVRRIHASLASRICRHIRDDPNQPAWHSALVSGVAVSQCAIVRQIDRAPTGWNGNQVTGDEFIQQLMISPFLAHTGTT